MSFSLHCLQERIVTILSPTIFSSYLMMTHIYFLPYPIIHNYMLYSLKVYKCLSLSPQYLAHLSCHFSRKFLLAFITYYTHWIRYLSPIPQYLVQPLSILLLTICEFPRNRHYVFHFYILSD